MIQFRHIVRESKDVDMFGERKIMAKTKPYLMDLESKNGSYLNDKRVAPSRYIELRDKDVISFADGETEFVIMRPPKEERK